MGIIEELRAARNTSNTSNTGNPGSDQVGGADDLEPRFNQTFGSPPNLSPTSLQPSGTIVRQDATQPIPDEAEDILGFPGDKYAKGSLVRHPVAGYAKGGIVKGENKSKLDQAIEMHRMHMMGYEKSGDKAEYAGAKKELELLLAHKAEMKSQGTGYAKGGPVLAQGMIEGPGTGTSDSIPTTLEVDDFIIPAKVLQVYGEDFFNKFNEDVDQESPQEDMMEGGEEVPARVANGEFKIGKEAVAKFGADFFNKIVASVTGEGVQPEMSETGEIHAARGYGGDDEGLPQSELTTIKSNIHNKPDTQTFIPKLAPADTAEQVKSNRGAGITGRGERATYATVVPPKLDSNTLALDAAPEPASKNVLSKPPSLTPSLEPRQRALEPRQPVDETQIPYAGAAGRKDISNPDGTTTPITNANRLSNRVVGGLPTTMASETIAKNGDRSYLIPGDNGNASSLGIRQTGTDPSGYGNFDVSYGKGQKGTVSASPELMKNYRENKGSFGVADMSKVPSYEEPRQQQQQTPQLVPQMQPSRDYSGAIAAQMNIINSPAPTGSFDGMIAHKKQVEAAQANLKGLVDLQQSEQQQASEQNRNITLDRQSQDRLAREAMQSQDRLAREDRRDALDVGKQAYNIGRDQQADSAASERTTYERDRDEKRYGLDQRKADLEEKKQASAPRRYTMPDSSEFFGTEDEYKQHVNQLNDNSFLEGYAAKHGGMFTSDKTTQAKAMDTLAKYKGMLADPKVPEQAKALARQQYSSYLQAQ